MFPDLYTISPTSGFIVSSSPSGKNSSVPLASANTISSFTFIKSSPPHGSSNLIDAVL